MYNTSTHVGPEFHYDIRIESKDNQDQKQNLAFIDAGQCGTWTRFINHSCDPNCEFVWGRVGTTRVCAVRALKPIKKGQELTIDYGNRNFDSRNPKCFCRTPICRYPLNEISGATECGLKEEEPSAEDPDSEPVQPYGRGVKRPRKDDETLENLKKQKTKSKQKTKPKHKTKPTERTTTGTRDRALGSGSMERQ